MRLIQSFLHELLYSKQQDGILASMGLPVENLMWLEMEFVPISHTDTPVTLSEATHSSEHVSEEQPVSHSKSSWAQFHGTKIISFSQEAAL